MSETHSPENLESKYKQSLTLLEENLGKGGKIIIPQVKVDQLGNYSLIGGSSGEAQEGSLRSIMRNMSHVYCPGAEALVQKKDSLLPIYFIQCEGFEKEDAQILLQSFCAVMRQSEYIPIAAKIEAATFELNRHISETQNYNPINDTGRKEIAKKYQIERNDLSIVIDFPGAEELSNLELAKNWITLLHHIEEIQRESGAEFQSPNFDRSNILAKDFATHFIIPSFFAAFSRHHLSESNRSSENYENKAWWLLNPQPMFDTLKILGFFQKWTKYSREATLNRFHEAGHQTLVHNDASIGNWDNIHIESNFMHYFMFNKDLPEIIEHIAKTYQITREKIAEAFHIEVEPKAPKTGCPFHKK